MGDIGFGDAGFGDAAAACLARARASQSYLVDLLREFIAIPSLSGSEERLAARVEAECARLGLRVRRDPCGSVIAHYGEGPVAILLDAHMDTVGPGDPAGWGFDPYRGKVESGAVFGRGACDNKGALAAMVCGLAIAKDLGLGRGSRTQLIGVVEEEVCEGWAVGEALRRGDVQADCVILGECTDLNLALGHRGRCEVELATAGRSCHGSSPWRGDNAIYEMAAWIRSLEDLSGRLPHSPTLGPASLAVTAIAAAAGSPNVVPDLCRAVVDRRLIPGESPAQAVRDILAAAPAPGRARARLVTYDLPSYTGLAKSVHKEFPAWELDEAHPLAAGAALAVELATGGRRPTFGRWEFATDGVMTAGTLGIPTVGFGPGQERWAHTVDDQVPVEQLVLAAAAYALMPEVLGGRGVGEGGGDGRPGGGRGGAGAPRPATPHPARACR